MKKLLLVMAATGLLVAETQIDVRHIIVRTPGEILVVDEAGHVVPAQLGKGLIVDWTTTPPTLNVLSSGAVIEKTRKIYRPTVATPELGIPEAFVPASLDVIVDGLEFAPGTEAEGADYWLDGPLIRFYEKSVPQPGWVVQLKYRLLK